MRGCRPLLSARALCQEQSKTQRRASQYVSERLVHVRRIVRASESASGAPKRARST
jgi:hypothetical protein